MMNFAPQRQLNASRGQSWAERLPHIRAANEAQRQWTSVCNRKDAAHCNPRVAIDHLPSPYRVNLPAVIA